MWYIPIGNIKQAQGNNLTNIAECFGIKIKRYFFNIFIESDKKLRKRILQEQKIRINKIKA